MHLLLLLLLFRYSAKSLIAQEKRLATSPQLVTRRHLPHAIVVRLQGRKSNVVYLTPETADTVGVLVRRIFHPGRSTMDVAWSVPLPCGRYFLVPLTGNKEGSKSLILLRVKHAQTRFPDKNLYTPMDHAALHSISSVYHPWGSCCYCLGVLLMKSALLLHLIGDKAPPVACNSGIARALKRRC